MLMLNQGKWKTVTELVNVIMVKKTIIRFTNRKYCKHALLNRKCLQTLNYKKLPLAFNCRQLKRKKLVFAMFTKNGMVYIKHNENSRPLLVTNISILRDMFPEFYNVCDETRENQNISGYQNV